MAAHDIKPEVSISKGLRRLKVGYVSIRHENRRTGMTTYYSCCPSINLKRDWLAEAGFKTDTPVDARVLPGYLILTAQEPQPVTEPEVLTQLRQTCKKLSDRKQRQISEFIDVVAKPQKRTQH
jgi:toxic protein SymE